MQRISIENFNIPPFDDKDVITAWEWFMTFISKNDWQKRKDEIEKKINIEFKNTKPFSDPLTEGTLLVDKVDVIGWYLYLIDVLINEPHKFEYFQGARIIPIFKRFGINLDLLKGIDGIEKKMRELLKKRRSEADALLFEMLTCLLWARNGYKVAFLEEQQTSKTPDLIAQKGDKIWHIECKRQSKTSDYGYRETAKRQKMISYISNILIEKNILLDIVFHVELESLPDNYLYNILKNKLFSASPGKIISNEEIDIDLTFINIARIKKHLQTYYVKDNSPMLNYLITQKPLENKAFTSAINANFFRIGEGETNNVYINNIENAFGVFWECDAPEAILAKARDIKNQIYSAMQQFNSGVPSIIHIGMETFDGPKVEMKRFEKIQNTIEKIDPEKTDLKWIFCHFFQSYSPPDSNWYFDETVKTISSQNIRILPPIPIKKMIVPEESDSIDGISHWERPQP